LRVAKTVVKAKLGTKRGKVIKKQGIFASIYLHFCKVHYFYYKKVKHRGKILYIYGIFLS